MSKPRALIMPELTVACEYTSREGAEAPFTSTAASVVIPLARVDQLTVRAALGIGSMTLADPAIEEKDAGSFATFLHRLVWHRYHELSVQNLTFAVTEGFVDQAPVSAAFDVLATLIREGITDARTNPKYSGKKPGVSLPYTQDAPVLAHFNTTNVRTYSFATLTRRLLVFFNVTDANYGHAQPIVCSHNPFKPFEIIGQI